MHYEQAGTTLLEQINNELSAAGEPPFVPWKLSKIGAFYLLSTVSTEYEVRLLMKRHQDAPPMTRNNGQWDYWPVPLGADNGVCRLDLLGIHVGPDGDAADVRNLAAGTTLANVPITGP